MINKLDQIIAKQKQIVAKLQEPHGPITGEGLYLEFLVLQVQYNSEAYKQEKGYK